MEALRETALLAGWDNANSGVPSSTTMGRLSRYTLVLLRWAALAGQILTLLFVTFVLGFPVPILPCALIVGLGILINLKISVLLPLDRRVGDLEAILQLGFDITQLSALLWLTGGISNPFAVLFLAGVVTGATTLSMPVIATLAILSMGLSLGLVFNAQPLPWDPDYPLDFPLVFRLCIWVAIVVGASFISLYAWRATKESRKMAAALAATEAMLAHEHTLSALGGLAAAAAHELGTPLATIQVTAKEMSRDIPSNTALSDDAALILSQAKRCRNILAQLSLRGDQGDIIHNQLSLEALLEEAAEPHINIGPDVTIHTKGQGVEPLIFRRTELIYALKNYIENAVDFAKTHVQLTGEWSENDITLYIEDDGAGFDPSIQSRLGQPYVTTRHRRRKNEPIAGGLGLGVFIATTLVKRTGGKVFFERSSLGGARIKIRWPKAKLVITNES